MVRIADGQNIPADMGGRLSLSSLIRPQEPAQHQPNMLESIEHILSNPVMQPVVQQGARLIAAYADKLTLENQEKMLKAQAAQQPAGAKPHTVVFGAGSDNP